MLPIAGSIAGAPNVPAGIVGAYMPPIAAGSIVGAPNVPAGIAADIPGIPASGSIPIVPGVMGVVMPVAAPGITVPSPPIPATGIAVLGAIPAIVPGAAPAVPGAAPSATGAALAVPGAAPSATGAAPAVPGAAPSASSPDCVSPAAPSPAAEPDWPVAPAESDAPLCSWLSEGGVLSPDGSAACSWLSELCLSESCCWDCSSCCWVCSSCCCCLDSGIGPFVVASKIKAGVGTNCITPVGLTCTVCPGMVTSVRIAPPGSIAVMVWLPSMVWLSVTLLFGEKFSTLPEPRIPMVAPGVFILNLSLLKLAIAPVKARNVPFTKDKTVLLDSSGLPLYWY